MEPNRCEDACARGRFGGRRIAFSIGGATRFGCGPFAPGNRSSSPSAPVHLEVAADLVEVLPAVAHDPARLRGVDA